MRDHLLGLPAHDGSSLYVPVTAAALGETVPVLVRAPAAARVRRLHARSTPDGEPRFVEGTLDRRSGGDAWWRVDVEVRNPVTGYRFLLDTDAGPRWLTAAGVFAHDVPDATDFRLLAHDPPPHWAAQAVVYQIFPDRFARSAAAADRALPDWAIRCDWDTPVNGRGPETPHQFYGGDLDGIVDHLDHIQRVGANTIYLTPIFPARSNHRYDAAAFDRVDPLLGGDAALVRLTEAVHRRGMRVVGDLTTNHCGNSHPWFQAATAGADAPEREMFYIGPDSYEAWLGVKSLPKFNWGSPLLRRRFDAIVQRWLRAPYGVDGWRVDVANMTGRHREASHTIEVARLLRRSAIQARPDALLVAEHAHDATGDLDEDGWHGSMNYAGFTRPLWSWLRGNDLDLRDFLGVPGPVPRRGGAEVVATMRAFSALVSWRTLTHGWNLLCSHDTARIATVLSDRGRTEVAVGLQMTLPGVPMVFAGDEIGLRGGNGEDSRRTMPWAASSTWDLFPYQALTALRRDCAALVCGGLRWAYVDDDVLCFLRETPTDRLLIMARRCSGSPVRVAGVGATAAENLYGGATASCAPDGSVVLPADGPTFQVWRLP